MNPKISLVIANLGRGGAQRVCVTVANGLSQRGYRVQLVAMYKTDSRRWREVEPGVDLVFLNVRHARWAGPVLIRYLWKERPQVVLSFNRQLSIVLSAIRTVVHLRFRLVSRNITFLSLAERSKTGPWHGGIVRILVRHLYSESDHFIAQSHSMKTDLMSYLSIPNTQITVINNPVSKRFFGVELARHNRPPMNSPYFFFAGGFEPLKQIEKLLRALARVVSQKPEVCLALAGTGSLHDEMVALAHGLGIDGNTKFLGYQDDLAGFYEQATATLLTSRFEGLPNTLLESIALGTPVVSFDCPSGPREIIEEGVNGFLVRYQDEEHLVQSMIKALDHPWDKEKIRATAEKYHPETILDQYEELLLAEASKL